MVRKWLALWLAGCWLVSPVMGGTQEQSDEAPTVKEEKSSEFDASLLAPFQFRSIGPALMSGRVADIAIDPTRPHTWYVAVGSGNLWKTTNAGTTFSPIFEQYGSYSLGCVTIDPQQPDTIWVGTGENVGGRHVGYGDGVYVSRDGGATFENKGLKGTEHISKILVDPRDSQVLYVAAQGPLWSAGGERGLFKSTDGGTTWNNILSKGTYTGVTDVVMDPENPDTLYAATHQRQRAVWALLNTGPESGIFKSQDGGQTWRELSQGLPGGDKGKISLGVSPHKHNVVYATIELVNREGGFYRSENFGESWTKMSDFVSSGTGPHYYQEIYLDPHRFDVIYHANNVLARSEDGGKTFDFIETPTKHVDNHAVVFHPTDPDFVLVGCDGGLYRSFDYGQSYQFFPNLPITQFYKVDVDYDWPFYHVVGGTQDNCTQYGPTATKYVQGITNEDWILTIGGDGHDNAIDPENPDIVYCESQEGFLRRFDRRTGESVDVRPQPAPGEAAFRFNWDSPILISPHDSRRLYFGSQVLHRSDDQGESWTTISPDLSRNLDRWKLPLMGRVWGIDAGFDLMAMSQFGNITSISESPQVPGLLYVGTDDGLIHVSEDGGENWRKIEKIYGVPERAFVNDIKADRHDPDTVYACLDDHKTGDFRPYLIRSRDRGRTWESLVNNLPERHLVWRLEQDHVNPELLFLGTEFGLFVSLNGGTHWTKFNNGMPVIPIRDLAIQKRENDLVCATFGRGFYVLDDYSALRELAADMKKESAKIFPVRDGKWFVLADRLGGPRGFQGDSYYLAENPAYGVNFTLYLNNEFKSLKARREEATESAKSAGKDAPVPTLAELHAENREVAPRFALEISDDQGRFVRRLELPATTGVHRVTWDYTGAPLGKLGFTPLHGPGSYKAQVWRISREAAEALGESVTFEVVGILPPTLPANERESILAFEREAYELQSKISAATEQLNDAETFLEEVENALLTQAENPQPIWSETRELLDQLATWKQRIEGDSEAQSRFIQTPPTVAQLASQALFSHAGSSHGPTKTHRQQLEWARQEWGKWEPELKSFLEEKIPEFAAKISGLGWDVHWKK